MHHNEMKVCAVTVNYKTPQLTMSAIESEFDDIVDLEGRIVVIDNDSADGSFESIRDAVLSRGWDDRVTVIRSPQNGGFGYGVNRAIRKIIDDGFGPEYIFLLGSDAIITRGGLVELITFLDAHPDGGAAGSYTSNSDGSTRVSAFRFPSVLSEFEQGFRLGVASKVLSRWSVSQSVPVRSRAVDWVSAASLLIRRRTLEQVGMFDESFFLYFEETDLCRRCELFGWPIYYVVESRATHIGKASTQINNPTQPRPRYWFNSRRRYFLKHHGVLQLWTANIAFIISRAIWRARRKCERKPNIDPPNFLKDFIRNSFWPVDVPRMRGKAAKRHLFPAG